MSFVVWELQLAQLGAAAAADILVVIGSQLFLGAAENAAGQVLLKNDLITVYINFNITVDVDAEGAAKLYRENDTAEVVNFSYDAGGFHGTGSSLIKLGGLLAVYNTFFVLLHKLYQKPMNFFHYQKVQS